MRLSLIASFKQLTKLWQPIQNRISSRFNALSISHKLTLSFGIIVGLTFWMAGRNYLGSFHATNNINRTQELRVPTALTSAKAEANLLRMSSHVRGYLATGESQYRDLYQQARQAFEQEIQQMILLLKRNATDENKDQFIQLIHKYEQWKILPDQLFLLRDSYFENQPALFLLKEEGEEKMTVILAEITRLIEIQSVRSPSQINTKILKDLADVKSSFALLVSSLRAYLLTRESSFRFEYAKYVEENNEALQKITQHQNFLTLQQRELLGSINQHRASFLELPPQLFTLAESDRYREDLYLFTTEAEPLAEEMLTLLQAIVTSQEQALALDLKIGIDSLRSAQIQTLFGGILALIVATSMAFLLRGKIADPILRLTEATTEIIKGNLGTKARIESGDEIGKLAETFNQMTYSLQQSRQDLENYSHALEEQAIALGEAKEASEAANRAKSQFLASMSHELRTPLNAILGFSQLMSRDPNIAPNQKETLGIINNSGEHLLTLINDILEVNKIEAGKVSLSLQSCDLVNLLKSIQKMLNLKAKNKGLNFDFELDSNLPQYIEVDEAKLRQVLINLLNNAIKFTPTGAVSLGVSPLTEWQEKSSTFVSLFFAVEDTGIGIAPHEIELLFEPFMQTESGIKSNQGTGLGLAISRKFIQLMGGDISVTSTLGKGSVFQFEITVKSLASVTTSVHHHPQILHLAPHQQRDRILIIEDKWENRLLLLNLLEPLGFKVRSAEDGEAGIKLWQEWQPDLILMDIQMPKMDGLEATEYIRTHSTRQEIIIALTASVFQEKRVEAMAKGCDDFISKPFQEQQLLEKIQVYLGVEYIYETEGKETTFLSAKTSQERENNLQQALAQMSPEWLKKLNYFAQAADQEQIQNLLAEIPPESQAIFEQINELMNQFNFDKIIDLTQNLLVIDH